MSHALPAFSPLPSGIAALPHLGVIRAAGEDAAKFLHGQLTQDFLLLPQGQARLAALCSAKGRMQASFLGLKTSPDEVLLITPADLLAPTLKRLSMFVLRAKVKLTDASADVLLRGLAGPLAAGGGEAAAPWQARQEGAAHIVTLYPAGGQPRALWIAPAGTALPEGPEGPELPAEAWRLGEVRSGIADITQPIAEAFVPQMLNYESVGGVNFKKGCYPGQEVVARSQFRGTLKRRGYVAMATAGGAPLAAGQEVFAPGDDQPVGIVAQAAQAPEGHWEAIVSMQTSAAGAPQLHAGSAQGPALSLLALPYELLEDI
ncbi:MAG: folate-binding protein YgfZ [Burkholderiaceae bacterium]|nr:folate-binding protein YgfZ [Burkholderiaceae bacterium]